MRRPRARRPSLVSVAGLALAGIAWLVLAPSSVGGTTHYVTTYGVSMAPRFHRGDLALIRRSADYRVGDVVAYRNRLLNSVVLHRIVGRDRDRFVFKGDNNNFLDPTHPARSELVGKLWVRVPHGGTALAGFRRPLVGVAVAGGLAAVLLLGGEAKRRRRRTRRGPVSATSGPLAAAPPAPVLPAPAATPSVTALPAAEPAPAPTDALIAAARPPAPVDDAHGFVASTTPDRAAGHVAPPADEGRTLAASVTPYAFASGGRPAAATVAASRTPDRVAAAGPRNSAGANVTTDAAPTRPVVLPQSTWLTPRARPLPPVGSGLPVVLPQPRPFTPRTITAPVAPPLPIVTEPAPADEPPAPMPAPRSLDRPHILIGAAVAAALFALLALLAFARPTTKPVAVKTPYREAVSFGYHAAVPPNAGPVYPGGSLSTGDPVFLRLTNRVQVTMGYRLAADAPHKLSGTTDVVLRLTSPSGWSRDLPLAPETPFEGDRADRVATLDLDQIRKLTRRVERLTGVPAGSYSLAVVPRVHATGTIAGQPVRTDFSPQATFELDAVQLRPTKGGEQARPSTVTSTRSAQNTVSLRGHSLPVATARWIALAGLAIAALAALVALLPRFRRPADPNGRAHARYGHLIVPITGIAVNPSQSAVDVATMDALVALAERGERLILHQRGEAADLYLVDDGSTLFRHQIGHVTAAQ